MRNAQNILVVGGGLAGLACARRLRELGQEALVLEASDAIGGRARTDVLDGFRLDRGFQVFLPAYPEARAMLDYAGLDLRHWRSGAAVWAEGEFHRVSDPSDGAVRALATLFSPAMDAADALPYTRLRFDVMREADDATWSVPERSAAGELAARGFSRKLIDRLFRPFYGGVFFDAALETSNRMLLFVHAMFQREGAASPARGIGAIAEQLVSRLDGQVVRYHARVTDVRADGRSVLLATGEEIPGRAVVVATEGDAAQALLGPAGHDPGFSGWRGTATFYFDAPEPPVADAIIVLDGDGTGPVNHLAVPSNVTPECAPPGRHLVAANVIGTAADESTVRVQLSRWFGAEAVERWRHLRTYTIPHALPVQTTLDPPRRPVRLADRLYICGDHRDNASINGALQSGRRAAEALLGDVRTAS